MITNLTIQGWLAISGLALATYAAARAGMICRRRHAPFWSVFWPTLGRAAWTTLWVAWAVGRVLLIAIAVCAALGNRPHAYMGLSSARGRRTRTWAGLSWRL